MYQWLSHYFSSEIQRCINNHLILLTQKLSAVFHIFILIMCFAFISFVIQNWSTLHDADLKVDIEKGEVVSATVSRSKDIPQFSFDNGKDFGSVWPHFKPPPQSSKEVPTIEKSFKRPIKEMSSASQRADRLRNLGFHVSEIRKHQKQQSREITFGVTTEKEQTIEESFVDSFDRIDKINDLDKPTDQMCAQSSVEQVHEFITPHDSNDCRRKSSRGQNGVTFQPEVMNSSASTIEFNPNIRPTCDDALPNFSTVLDSLLYDTNDSITDCVSKHSTKSKEVSSSKKKKKMKRRKKVKPADMPNMKNPQVKKHLFESIQNKWPNSRPRIPSIPVEGYCNKVMCEPFYTSLTLSKEPLPVNNFIEGDLEDEVFLTDSIPFQSHDEKGIRTMKPKTIPFSPVISRDLATTRPKRDQMKHRQKGNNSVIKRDGVANNNCDIIR